MATPTYAQLAAPTSQGPGLVSESVQDRLLTVAAMLASGQNPDGTTNTSIPGTLTQAVSGGSLKVFAFNPFTSVASQGGSGTNQYSLAATSDPNRTAQVNSLMVPGVAGLSYTFRLGQITPSGNTNYNWFALDQAILDMQRVGGRAQFRILTAPAAGSFSGVPSWLSSTPNVVPIFNNAGNQVLIPWDTAYQAQLQTFINAVGARYNGNPYLYGIHIGSAGTVGEMILNANPSTSSRIDGSGGSGTVNYTNASAVISDTIVTAGDSGRAVAGLNFPTGVCTVGTPIVANTSFTLFVNGSPTAPTGSGNSVTVATTASVPYQTVWGAGNSQCANSPYLAYSDSRFISAWQNFLTTYTTAFPNTAVLIDIDEPFGGTFQNPDVSNTKTSCLPTIINNLQFGGLAPNFAGKVMRQQNSLQPSSLAANATALYRPYIMAATEDGTGNTTTGPYVGSGYQMIGAIGYDQGIQSALSVAIQDRCSYVEMYAVDILQYPQLVQYFAGVA